MFDDVFDSLVDELDHMPIEQQEELYRKTNPDYFIKVDMSDETRKVVFSCKKCGTVIPKVRPDKDYIVSECPGCLERLKNPNYVGICKKNWVGRIHNGMEITAQYTDPVNGYLCDIKCAVCDSVNAIKNGLSMIDVLNRRYYHDCDKSKVHIKCSSCNDYSEVAIKEIMGTKDILCQKCGCELDKTELSFELAIYDKRLNYLALKRANGNNTLSKYDLNGDIFREE